jgi:L-asparaginase II
MSELMLHVTRGAVVESRHTASLAIVDPAGQLLAAAGYPDRITYWRSAAKPVQILPLIADGGVERFNFTEDEIAVMTASHSGEEVHIAAVQSILEKLELGEDALRCGAHLPYSQAAAEELMRADEFPRAIHSNCSGKHSGMLAPAVLHGWPLYGYLEYDHAVQQEIIVAVSALTGVPAAVIPLAVDGCGAPTYALTLHAMATAYARLAVPKSLPSPWSRVVEQVTLAMRRYPHMIAGTGRFDTSLMAATEERIIAKGGAEGVMNIGLPELGLGIAIKIEDGSERAVAPLALEVLCRLGVLNEEEAGSLADLHRPTVRNLAGHPVGTIEVIVPESLALTLSQMRRGNQVC